MCQIVTELWLISVTLISITVLSLWYLGSCVSYACAISVSSHNMKIVCMGTVNPSPSPPVYCTFTRMPDKQPSLRGNWLSLLAIARFLCPSFPALSLVIESCYRPPMCRLPNLFWHVHVHVVGMCCLGFVGTMLVSDITWKVCWVRPVPWPRHAVCTSRFGVRHRGSSSITVLYWK